MKRPAPYERYRHFKGGIYQIIAIATDSETRNEMVVYQALYGDYGFFVRELSMFMSPVDKNKYPDVKQADRFELITENDNKPEQVSDTTDDHVVKPFSAFQVRPDNHAQTEAPTNNSMDRTIEEEAAELNMNPLVIAFLDSDSVDDRIKILGNLHNDITDDMIDVMAMAIDTSVGPGDVETRYEDLKSCLHTIAKYETNRLRG